MARGLGVLLGVRAVGLGDFAGVVTRVFAGAPQQIPPLLARDLGRFNLALLGDFLLLQLELALIERVFGLRLLRPQLEVRLGLLQNGVLLLLLLLLLLVFGLIGL